VAQIIGHILGRRITLGGSFRESLEANTVQFLWDGIFPLAEGTYFHVRDLLQHFLYRIPLERSSSGQQFIQDYAQAENVGPAIDPMPFATRLFRRHIARRSGVTWPFADIPLPQGQPEIRHEWLPALVEEEVAGLDVPMHDALLVGIVESLGHGCN
jgi:hypothetical protein